MAPDPRAQSDKARFVVTLLQSCSAPYECYRNRLIHTVVCLVVTAPSAFAHHPVTSIHIPLNRQPPAQQPFPRNPHRLDHHHSRHRFTLYPHIQITHTQSTSNSPLPAMGIFDYYRHLEKWYITLFQHHPQSSCTDTYPSS